eukprot:8363284-Prorocentrum_lima.AAC.1
MKAAAYEGRCKTEGRASMGASAAGRGMDALDSLPPPPLPPLVSSSPACPKSAIAFLCRPLRL